MKRALGVMLIIFSIALAFVAAYLVYEYQLSEDTLKEGKRYLFYSSPKDKAFAEASVMFWIFFIVSSTVSWCIWHSVSGKG